MKAEALQWRGGTETEKRRKERKKDRKKERKKERKKGHLRVYHQKSFIMKSLKDIF